MARENILVVDDEEDILSLVEYNLVKEDFNVNCVMTGEEALSRTRSAAPDLLVLDLMLPGVDGLEVCRILKNDPQTKEIPIVMLTARGEESDVVRGLELGADDYITKPFSPNILLARIRAVLRRKSVTPADENSILKIHGIEIHPGRHEVLIHGATADLTLTEFRILHYLVRRPGWVFTRTQIIDAVHGDDYPVTERSVDVQIVGLRKKLGDCGKYIETVRGVGYRFQDS
ncbi:MAG: response regulator [Candidatus Omnitrophota bacterium]